MILISVACTLWVDGVSKEVKEVESSANSAQTRSNPDGDEESKSGPLKILILNFISCSSKIEAR